MLYFIIGISVALVAFSVYKRRRNDGIEDFVVETRPLNPVRVKNPKVFRDKSTQTRYSPMKLVQTDHNFEFETVTRKWKPKFKLSSFG